MGKFLVKESKAGLRFNLVANNGEVIAASQVYKSASGCKNGIASVAKKRTRRLPSSKTRP